MATSEATTTAYQGVLSILEGLFPWLQGDVEVVELHCQVELIALLAVKTHLRSSQIRRTYSLKRSMDCRNRAHPCPLQIGFLATAQI